MYARRAHLRKGPLRPHCYYNYYYLHGKDGGRFTMSMYRRSSPANKFPQCGSL